MATRFEEAKASLESLTSYKTDQVCDETFDDHLEAVIDGLLQANGSEATEKMWCDETKLLHYPKIFIRVYHATQRATYNAENKSLLYDIIDASLGVLGNACNFDSIFYEFYKRELAIYLLNLLARFSPLECSQSEQKRLIVNRCLATIKIALCGEPRVGEQLRQHQCKDVLQRFINCGIPDIALDAVSICARITTDRTGRELQIPDGVLSFCVETCKRLLNGETIILNYTEFPAASYLLSLQQLILCSDDFNKRVMQYTPVNLLDLLTQVLEAPNAWDHNGGPYFHKCILDEAGLVTSKLKTTLAEKFLVIKVCLALLLSERRHRRNSHEMRKHKRIIAAVNKAASSTDEDIQKAVKSVLWELKPKQSVKDVGVTLNLADATAGVDQAAPSSEPNSNTENNTQLADLQAAHYDSAVTEAVQQPKRTGRSSYVEQSANGIVSNSSEPVPASSQRSVMISYASRHKRELVLRINESLKQAGIDRWIYNENILGDYFDLWAKAVEQSAVVLVCYSNAYSNSDVCHQELNYARVCGKPRVFVRLEDFKPCGWLGISVAGRKYHDFAAIDASSEEDDENYEFKMVKLLRELKLHL